MMRVYNIRKYCNVNIVTSTNIVVYGRELGTKNKYNTRIYKTCVIKTAAAVAAVAVVRNIKLNHGRWHGRNNGFRHSTLSGRVYTRRQLGSRSRTFCTGIFYSIRFFYFRHSDNHHDSLWFTYSWCTRIHSTYALMQTLFVIIISILLYFGAAVGGRKGRVARATVKSSVFFYRRARAV